MISICAFADVVYVTNSLKNIIEDINNYEGLQKFINSEVQSYLLEFYNCKVIGKLKDSEKYCLSSYKW